MYYVSHEMVAFKTRVIEKFKSESTVKLCYGMKNPLNRYREYSLICLNVKCDYFIATVTSLLP